MGTQWSFNDMFKKGFLTNATMDITLTQMLMTLGVSLLVGLFIYIIYKRTYRGVLYSKTFNVSLIAIALITTLVIMTITSNVVLSLGMVGALSIVRFRTAIKDPFDIVFMFWSIGIGIITGAGFYFVAALGSLIIGLAIIILTRTNSAADPFLLVVQCDGDSAEQEVMDLLKSKKHRFSLRSKTVAVGRTEVTYELRLRDKESTFVNEISRIGGVGNAVLISYNGDYVS